MNKNKANNNTTEAIDIIFKMRADGRIDKEEATLLLEIIFSDLMDDETFGFIRLIYKIRPKDDFWKTGEPLQVSPRGYYYL